MFNKKEDKGVMLFILFIAFVVGLKNVDNIKQIILDNGNKPAIKARPALLKTTTLRAFLNDSSNTKEYIVKHNNMSLANNNRSTNVSSNKSRKKKFFRFNPNNISRDSLILLGLPSKVAFNWTKYLQKGGHFHSKKDILKIYGLTQTKFNQIEKYIILEKKKGKKTGNSINSIATGKKSQNKLAYKSKAEDINNAKIELNTCNASDLIALRGIGQVLSKRIVKFRDKLGGYISIDQLKEVYGLPPETFEGIKGRLFINPRKIRKLKINIEDKKALKAFPYISYRLATQIVKYRQQHGYFSDAKDLLKIKSLDSDKLKKIAPYLDYAIN